MLADLVREVPVEQRLDHDDQHDEEDHVAVDVGVGVPLLLLVHHDLEVVVQSRQPLVGLALLLLQGTHRLLQPLQLLKVVVFAAATGGAAFPRSN